MFIQKIWALGQDFQDHHDQTVPFEDQAYRILRKHNLCDIFSYEEMMEYSKTQRAQRLKFYRNNEFGEYPITVYRCDFFHIDVYVWNDHDTTLHDHSFAGAFKILQGSSLQLRYSFCERERDKDLNIAYGDLTNTEKKVLRRGDCEKITPYEQFIHQVWHLERPTITLCLRNCALEPFQNLYHQNGVKGVFEHGSLNSLVSLLYPMDKSQMEEKLYSLDDMSLLWGLSSFGPKDRSKQGILMAHIAHCVLKEKCHLEFGSTKQERKFSLLKYL